MKLDNFEESFPMFPVDKASMERFAELIKQNGLVEDDEWAAITSEVSEPIEIVKKVALKENVSEIKFAKIEASILNVPFINLDETEIPLDTFKLIKPEMIKDKKIIPVRLSGQELLSGTLTPADENLITILGESNPLAIRLGKVISSQLNLKVEQILDNLDPSKTKRKKKKGPRKRLGDILVESNYLKEEELMTAIKAAREAKLRMGAYLVKNGFITNKQLSIALSKQFGIPFVDLDESLVDPVLATLLPKKLCYEQIMCPVKRENKKLVLAMTDPTDIITIDHVEMMTGMRISPVVSSELSIMASLSNLYGDDLDSLAENIGGDYSGEEEGLDMNENDAPIIKLVNLILAQAIQLNVSDIHIEIYEKELRVRFRLDGVMKLHMTPARAAHAGVVSRIKVMANLDIAETRRPQDGRIKLHLKDKKVDLRVSCIPCVWGEKIVMRILDQGNLKVDLRDLGFEPHVLETFMDGVKSPNGIVLVTGPTGSGKTTTLYSSLYLLNNPGVNIMTAEDPVEYNLMGVNQVQCHPDIGLTFSAALRSFLRQDPDVVMLGEIRDFETANIAIKAAMTGHLVLSTLHTNDAPGTVARLLNMGIEPFSLATALRVVEAQRLVRRICPVCSTTYKPEADLVKSLGIDERLIKKLRLENEIDLNNLTFTKGTGCPECENTGLKGRQGIYEVLRITPRFKELIEAAENTEVMRKQALKDGMLSLRESALYKLLTGRTAVEEVFRATMDDDAGGTTVKKPKPLFGAELGAVSSSNISVAGIGELTKEMHEFTEAMQKMTGGSDKAVSINSELLKANLSDPLSHIRTQASKKGDPAKILPIIKAQGQKIDFNMNNMVQYFSNDAPAASKVDLKALVEKEIFGKLKEYVVTARLISGKKSIGKGLKVSKSLPKDLPHVKFDSKTFASIASNLVINSLIAVENGGEIKIVARMKPNTKDRVELVVFDSGVGIEKDMLDKLFVPFTPLGRKTLGLGLNVVKKVVESQDGKISINSKPGTNTLVTIEFPAIS